MKTSLLTLISLLSFGTFAHAQFLPVASNSCFVESKKFPENRSGAKERAICSATLVALQEYGDFYQTDKVAIEVIRKNGNMLILHVVIQSADESDGAGDLIGTLSWQQSGDAFVVLGDKLPDQPTNPSDTDPNVNHCQDDCS